MDGQRSVFADQHNCLGYALGQVVTDAGRAMDVLRRAKLFIYICIGNHVKLDEWGVFG
jgi:hypothetical protein